MPVNSVFLSACISGNVALLGLIYLLIACVIYKRRGGNSGGTKELLFLHTISVINMIFFPWSYHYYYGKGLPPLVQYVGIVLLWWCYRFAVQWIYYCRFCAVNLGFIEAPWIRVILRGLLTYPLIAIILRLTRFYCSKDEGGYCAPYQTSVYWTLPSIILFDLAYLIGFGVLMRRFQKLSLGMYEKNRPKTRKILVRYFNLCLITNVCTGVQTIFYCAMQKNYLSVVVAVLSIDMLIVNGLLVLIYPDWRLRMWPWGGGRFALAGDLKSPLVRKELPSRSKTSS